MKIRRVLACAAASVMLMGSACAASKYDLSGMTYQELVKLRDLINIAMWNSDEWQEVTVPQGVWKVGEDIPAGHWTVKCTPARGVKQTQINWGEKLDSDGDSIAWEGRHSILNNVNNPNYKYYEYDGELTEYSFEVFDGDYIVIEKAPAVFMPYQGKPSLGFK